MSKNGTYKESPIPVIFIHGDCYSVQPRILLRRRCAGVQSGAADRPLRCKEGLMGIFITVSDTLQN